MAKEKKKKEFSRHKWLISQLRRLTLRYPPAFNYINSKKIVYYIKSKKGKDLKRVKFNCDKCGKQNLKRSEVNLDHKIPVVSSTGFEDIGVFLERLFCDISNLWLICLSCHSEKTQSENKERQENKQIVKNKVDTVKK